MDIINKQILNYRIERLIGTGGMGSVYLASNINIEQKVAIKRLNADIADNVMMRERFKAEANLLCSLDHPHIVKFYNYVENEDGVFLIMEYVDGITLLDFLQNKNGLIVESRVFDIYDQILDAFAYAHKKGIVHRDIKPSNIVLTPDKEGAFNVKILDFGIATIISETREDEKNWVVGTPSYMSPEQVTGGTIDARSDIYALGVLLHQMLTGHAPYDETTLSEVRIKDKVLNEQLPRMKTYYPYISDKIQKIVDKAVEKEPGKRFQTCGEFRSAMKKLLRPDKFPKVAKILIAVAALILVGAGLFIWDYNRTKVVYYKDYVEEWAIPQGIGKLSKSEVAHRTASYRFEYKKRKLQRMSYVNGRGHLTKHTDSEHISLPIDMLLFYNNDGKVDYVKYLDCSGKVLFKKDYNEKLNTAIFQYDDEFGTELTLASRTSELFTDPFDTENGTKGKISRYLLTYDDNGYVVEIRYAGYQNIPVGDVDGIYGRQFTLDKMGRVVEERFLGFDGKPKANKKGLGMKKQTYDDNDNWIETRYCTIDGQLASDDTGVPIVKLEYDKYGNRIKESYVNEQGDLVNRNDINAAMICYKIDDHGGITEETLFGTDGNRCYCSSNFSGVRFEYDDNGYQTKAIYIDINDEPCVITLNNSNCKMVNDEHGNVLEYYILDENGEVADGTDGYACIFMKYDSVGNVISRRMYQKDMTPFMMSNGVSGMEYEYNVRNQRVKETNLDTAGRPCNNSYGICITKLEYDLRGNVVLIENYDTTGTQLVASSFGYAILRSTYDDNGNETERAFFDDNDKPVNVDLGYAKWVSEYDEFGNMTKRTYYNKGGAVCVIKDGYAIISMKYDERGNIVESQYFDETGKPAKNFYVNKYTYDNRDNETEFSIFTSDQKPATNANGFHRRTQIYNNRNNVTEIHFYDTKGEPTINKEDGYASAKYTYDDKGNIVHVEFFGTDGKPHKASSGYASMKNEYDARGWIVRQTYFDTEGNPTDTKSHIPECKVTYDSRGNITQLVFADGKGHIINNSELGYAISKNEYDNRNNVISTAYFDENDKPILVKDQNYSKVVNEYDNRNNKISETFYDADGNMRTKDYAVIKYKYDKRNNMIEMAAYDANGKPACIFPPIHKAEAEYEGPGTEATFIGYYDVKGKLLQSTGKRKTEKKQDTPQEDAPAATNNANQKSTPTPTDKPKKEPDSGNSNWQKVIDQTHFPVRKYVYDDVTLTSATYTKTSCTVYCRLEETSKYNVSDDELSSLKSLIRDKVIPALRAEAKIPNNVSITFIVSDKANRNLFETKK